MLSVVVEHLKMGVVKCPAWDPTIHGIISKNTSQLNLRQGTKKP
jgi:hypothetical protein